MFSIEASRRRWSIFSCLAAITSVWRGGPALFAEGQWPDESRKRMGLLALDGKRPRMLWHGYLEQTDIPRVRAELAKRGALLDGGFDFMFSTPWKVAWCLSAAELSLYTPRGLRARVTRDSVTIRGLLSEHVISSRDVVDVIAEGRAFHARTRVALRTVDGKHRSLATAYDFGAWLADDPWEIYEAWTREVATLVRATLGAMAGTP